MGLGAVLVEDGAEVVDERDLEGLLACFRELCSPGSGFVERYEDGMNGLP